MGEVFQEYSEKNHPELPALTIIQGGGTVLREESERKLQYDKSSLAGYKMVREDDFIVHLRSFEGGLEKSNHNGLISPAYHTFHGDEVDSRFYYPYFRSYEFIKHKLVPHVYGIRDGRSIDIDSMKTIEIPWTSYEEQKKIGDYIESLDTLITLHQRKCDELKEVPFHPTASDLCTMCGLCAKLCPVHAIPFDAPNQTKEEQCISCMRCIQVCPSKARHLNEQMLSAVSEKMKPLFAKRKENELFL